MIPTAWMIGYCFTIGFITESGFGDKLLFAIIWPVALGIEVRKLFDSKAKEGAR